VMMLKHTVFLKFRPELDREEADRRWRDELGPIELSLTGLERYVQNPVVITTTNAGAVEGPPGFDGMTSMWFTDMAAFDAALASHEWAEAERCAAGIFDVAWRGGVANAEIEERVRRVGLGAVVDGVSTPPGEPIKLIGLLRYRTDRSREDANNYWRTTHGRIALDWRRWATTSRTTPSAAPAGGRGWRSTVTRRRGSSTSTPTRGRWRRCSGRRSRPTAPSCSTCRCSCPASCKNEH
jgi:hypothetical protein